MHVVAKVLSAAYIALALFAAAVLVQASVNLVDVTDVSVNIAENISVASVELDWSGNDTDAAEVRVAMNVTNPGRITIEIIAMGFVVYMDDPNDPRPWYDADKLRTTEIGGGGFSARRGQGVLVRPGETATLNGFVGVSPGTSRMLRLDRPDADGRYHAFVMSAWIAHTFVDFEVKSPPQIYAAPYYDAAGVLPSG
ncbi:MAG: hypothetical protein AABY30_05455 [Candidatus Thermoplasmatota archaeon]